MEHVHCAVRRLIYVTMSTNVNIPSYIRPAKFTSNKSTFALEKIGTSKNWSGKSKLSSHNRCGSISSRYPKKIRGRYSFTIPNLMLQNVSYHIITFATGNTWKKRVNVWATIWISRCANRINAPFSVFLDTVLIHNQDHLVNAIAVLFDCTFAKESSQA